MKCCLRVLEALGPRLLLLLQSTATLWLACHPDSGADFTWEGDSKSKLAPMLGLHEQGQTPMGTGSGERRMRKNARPKQRAITRSLARLTEHVSTSSAET